MIRCLLVFLLLLQCIPAPAAADIYADEEPAPESTQTPRYEPDKEALRSVLIPGWSQHRQGEVGRGWGYGIVAGITFVYMIGLYEVPIIGNEKDNFGQVFAGVLYALNAVLSGFDAYNSALESNRENGWDLEPQAARPDRGIRLPLVRIDF